MKRSLFSSATPAASIADLAEHFQEQLPSTSAKHSLIGTRASTKRSERTKLVSLDLCLPAEPSCIAHVRKTLAGICDLLNFDPQAREDVALAVTEAATNVVLHAYEQGPPGPLFIAVHAQRAAAGKTELTVTVRDDGSGIRSSSDASEPSTERTQGLGLGLRLMRSLSSSMQFSSDTHGSTEVTMIFANDRPPAR